MRFFLFIVGLALVLGSATAVYLNILDKNRPPEPAPPPSRADTLKPLIEKGDVRALVAMGDLYRDGGGGVEKSLPAALRLYEAAARKGYPPAQFAMGRAYDKGEGVREDPVRAVHWYEPAAKLGHDANAQYALGQLHESGRGVAHDPARALEWYLRAAVGGHPVAQYLAGAAFERGHDGNPDLIEAYHYYLLAAERADAVKAANPKYDAPAALARIAAKTNRSQRDEAEKRAARTRAGYRGR